MGALFLPLLRRGGAATAETVLEWGECFFVYVGFGIFAGLQGNHVLSSGILVVCVGSYCSPPI